VPKTAAEEAFAGEQLIFCASGSGVTTGESGDTDGEIKGEGPNVQAPNAINNTRTDQQTRFFIYTPPKGFINFHQTISTNNQ